VDRDSNSNSNIDIAINSYRELYSNYVWYQCNEDTNPEEFWELRNSDWQSLEET
jgi:hypothetical protein